MVTEKRNGFWECLMAQAWRYDSAVFNVSPFNRSFVRALTSNAPTVSNNTHTNRHHLREQRINVDALLIRSWHNFFLLHIRLSVALVNFQSKTKRLCRYNIKQCLVHGSTHRFISDLKFQTLQTMVETRGFEINVVESLVHLSIN